MAQFLTFLRSRGVVVHVGRWLITASPLTFLLELPSTEDFRGQLWQTLHIGDILDNDIVTRHAVSFGFMVARFITSFLEFRNAGQHEEPTIPLLSTRGPVAVHGHEWQGAVAIPLLRVWKVPVALLFTTHATLIGRHLCASGDCAFYQHLTSINGEHEAAVRRVYPAYSLERAAAHTSHVFTTVSDLTSEECSHFLGRNPDIITPNGLLTETYGLTVEIENLHTRYKKVF